MEREPKERVPKERVPKEREALAERSPCSTRFNPKTTRNIAAAGLSSHGKSANTRMFVDASCSIVPQLAMGSGKPRPTYDSVASATMKAGTSSMI